MVDALLNKHFINITDQIALPGFTHLTARPHMEQSVTICETPIDATHIRFCFFSLSHGSSVKLNTRQTFLISNAKQFLN